MVAVLVFTAPGVANPATAAFCFRALEVLAIWPMALAAPDSLLRGLLLGRGRWYGLLRHWWVAVKLAMNLLLTALVIVLLRPGLQDPSDYGRRIADGLPASFGSSLLMFPPTVPASVPVFAMVLPVSGLWGRTGRITAMGRSTVNDTMRQWRVPLADLMLAVLLAAAGVAIARLIDPHLRPGTPLDAWGAAGRSGPGAQAATMMAGGERGGLGTKVPIAAVSSVTSTRDGITLATAKVAGNPPPRAGRATAARRQVLHELTAARAGQLRASGQAG